MVHFIIGLIISSILVGNAWAKCDDSQIKYERSTSFGLSWDSKGSKSAFGSEVTVNIPLVIDGKPACYHQESALNVTTDRVKENEFVEYEITPMEADFENVPSPSIVQYMNIEYESESKASHVQIMSFLCSNETPIGGDAFADSLLKLSANGKEGTGSIDVFIATGQAADNLSISQSKKAKAKVFDQFLEIYEDRAESHESFESEGSNIYVPNIIAGTSIHSVSSVERKLYSSFFSRTSSSINGCSKQFIAKMQDYLIDNVVKNQPFKNIEIKKKRFSSKFKMKWTL
jgi:hypothetical protein